MWLKGNERTLHHFIRHDGLRIEKCINVTAKHNLAIKWSEYAQKCISGVRHYFTQIFMLSFIILAVRSSGSWLLAFCCRFLWIFHVLNIHFVVRSCRSWIVKVSSVLRSWRSWILRILDPKFTFYYGILEILDLGFLLLQWDPGDPGS